MTRRHQLQADRFHERLRDTRERAGLTQAQLAELVGYADKQGIGHLETGRSAPETALCERLARALGISPAWLAWGIDGTPLELSAGGYGARLREARLSAKLSQRRLAESLGFSAAASISLLESESTRLDLSLCEVAARVLGVQPEWLGYGWPTTSRTRSSKKKS